jgi:Ca-activated chloride channel family protein
MQIKEAVLLIRGERKQIPLQGIRIEAEVLDLACRTTIVQRYRNTEKKAIEAVYCFPVEEGAAVYDFEVKTDGISLKGVVEEREKAFETYDRALENGDASFLLDQESGDILFMSVGNIKPDQDVTISIRYVKQLSLVDGVVRLQIPTSVSPRYAPSGSDPLKIDRITPDYDLDVPYGLTLRVTMKSSFMEDVTSPSHRINVGKKGEHRVVELEAGNTSLDRDFVLEIGAKEPGKPVCLCSTHENGDKACMFRFTPQFNELKGESERKSETIFVLDCSGSMQGSSIREAKEALGLSLRALSEGDLFNIVRFGTTFQTYHPQSITYSSQSLDEALDYARRIHADMGGTEIYRPLEHICSLPARAGYSREVLIITDGQVANPDDVIRLVAASVEKNQFLRVYTIGIGYGASPYLVQATARAGRGACEMIMPGERIQPKVLRQFSRMGQPSLTDISLRFKAAKAEPAGALPPLFEGDSYTVFSRLTRLEAGATVAFSGSYVGKQYRWNAELRDVGHDSIVPTLWALSRIEHLKNRGAGGSNQKGRQEQRIRKEILELGLRYNLLTDYTSFVAVEERAEDDKQRERPEYRRIPVMLTKDWHGVSQGAVSLVMMPSRKSPICGGKLTLDEPFLKKKARSIRIHKISGASPDDILRQEFRKVTGDFNSRRVPPKAAGKKPTVPWYEKLLKTQQANGSFESLGFLGRSLGIPLQKLKDFSKTIDGTAKDQEEKVLSTWLAVVLLSSHSEAASAASRAIRKAEMWLAKLNAQCPTVEGVPMKESFEKRFGITLNESMEKG